MSDFYDLPKWRSLRESILKRDKYQCQLSRRFGKFRQAEIVHHIFPLEDYPEYAFEAWNLISVSKAEHNRIHDRDTDELTEYGAELLRRTARKRGMEIPEKYRHTIKERRHGRMASRLSSA